MVKLFYSEKTNKIYSIVPVMTNYTRLLPFTISQYHIHPVYHMVFIFHGSGSIELDKYTVNLSEGDILLINPNEKHIFRTHDSELFYFALNFILLEGNEGAQSITNCSDIFALRHNEDILQIASKLRLEAIFDIASVNSCIIYDKSKWSNLKKDIQAFHGYIQSYLDDILFHREDTAKANLYSMQVYDFLFSLYIKFLRVTENSNDKINDMIILKIISYMDNNINKKLCLADMAAELNYNASYISRLFKNKMNMNISKYYNILKIKKACNLLRNSDTSITDIAYSLGYNSSQHFSRSFKEVRKITPGEFRNNIEYF